jgi:hypothetical protein
MFYFPFRIRRTRPSCAHIASLLSLIVASVQVCSAQAYDFHLDVLGPFSAYAGSEAYFQLSPVAVNPPQYAKFFYSVSLSGNPVQYSLSCRIRTCSMDALGRYFDLGIPILRVSLPANQAPGLYSVVVRTDSEGITKTTNIPLRVLAPAAPVPPAQFLPSLPIPGLSKWQTEMLRIGQKCDPAFNYGTFSYEQTDWFYDGARVYFQIGDYTGDRSWDACALNIARQYRDRVIALNGKLSGWRVFTRGLRMAYERTGDPGYRQAVILLSQNAGYIDYELSVNESLIRENAYAVNALIDSERLGQPRSPHLSRLVNYLIGHYDRLFVQKKYTIHQTFFDGLAAEALIDYYDLTGDPRILPTIKLMLDWLWDFGWNKSTYRMVYNPDPAGPTCASGCQMYLTDLINLVVPAYAWYWRVTGDIAYQQRGDELFAHALDTEISHGKQFSQNYHWSPNYVRWRTVDPVQSCMYTLSSPTALAPAGGGTVSVKVITRPDCPWSTRSEAPWAAFPSQLSPAGNGTAVVAVSQNPDKSARTATVHIGNRSIILTQEAALVSTVAGAAAAVGKRSIDVPVTLYGNAAGLGSTVAGSTSLRIEARFHNWSSASGNSRGTVGMQGFKLFWESDRPSIICQASYDSTSANSVNLSVAGRTDFYVRCQRDVANNRVTGEIWNADGSGYSVSTVTITKWAATLNLSSIVFGRWSWETSNAAFRAGFLRISSTVTPLAIVPVEASEPGNIANYEFENNTDDTSGNNRHLKMNTAPAYFDTIPVVKRSIDVPATLYGAATGLGSEAAGNTPVQIEARIHNWSLMTAGNSRGTVGMQGFRLVWEPDEPNLTCRAPYDSTSVNYVKLPAAGRTDFYVRCQRDVANNRVTGEIWNADGSGYFVSTVAITKWVATLNLSSIVFGRWSWEAANATFRAGFVRISNTVKPLGAPLGETTGSGNIANYEFENNTDDTSGNNRHLKVNVTPVFLGTPGN